LDALNCPPLWVSFGLNLGGAGAGPWRGWRAVARQYCIPTTPTDDVTSATWPCGLSRRARRHPPGPCAGRLGTHLRHRSRPPQQAGPGATRPDRGPGGSGPTSATAPCRRSKLGPMPPARAPLGLVAGWSNGGPLPRHWAGGPCTTVSYLGRQLGVLARWCAGSPELCASLIAEPVGQSAGSCEWGAAAGPVWTASGADLDEAHSLRSV
jgi:hypothetical protein